MSGVQRHQFGGKRDVEDRRDHPYDAGTRHELPPHVDLRKSCGAVYDQLHVCSCSANALASLLVFVGNVEKRPIAAPSRLFLYYNARKLEGTLPKDGGATIRSGLKVAAKLGACSEELWPYELANVAHEPSPHCYEDAKQTRALKYLRIAQNLDHLRACLAEGYAFIFGMQAYEQSFVQAQHTGTLPMPGAGETLMGGHAVLAVGYDDRSKSITALNSLGSSWGKNGYFSIPYTFVADADLAYDFWTIRSVS